MTNESIIRYIDAVNAHSMRDYIFLAPLAANVDIAKVWGGDPRGEAYGESSYDFFFIRDEADTCVAAVLDMGNDLHVLVKAEHRGRGTLSRAMTAVVLPWLYQCGRKVQRVTFEDPMVGAYCVRCWGFTLLNDREADKDLTAFASVPLIQRRQTPLNDDHFTVMKQRIRKASLYLTMVKDQLEIARGFEDDLLADYAREVHDLDDHLREAVIQIQQNLQMCTGLP